ncbi:MULTISPECIES: beta-N-acetylhexosaminidase [unclassified Sphingobium]|uniref:beta-N-acetylhexosaminidase n=1 Tax=unclassified Sphingobium TaxID=2611147 RepID=UPI002223F3B5|nr:MULTISPECIES: beta-N-acetylhexosaminidase [unclassified Sphingobium]MCW2395446.1 beta-N-acetylhexosaminidase [Sphingobium sp. B8D3B]MCW2418961.1 beta-N-acetylhexosaminidase [Sphingobium sp. B8D3C]
MKPVIFGLAGERVSAEERALFRACDPAGYILFGRNIADRAQLRALTDELRDIARRDDLYIMIDQEGGRVARMRPPHWPDCPPAARFDALYDLAPSSAMEAARCNARLLGTMLSEVGITANAAPVLDLRYPGASDIVGDRSFGAEPMRVAALGRATLEGLRDGGVAGIVKHMPGHGRALVDSHLALPTVSASADEMERDLAPFRALRHAPAGMTAHIVYTAWDADRPASLSPYVIREIIRGAIGFDGLLMSDDLDMKALNGPADELAEAVVAAGCDLALNCWGRMDEMTAIAARLPDISDAARERLDRAMASIAAGADPAWPGEKAMATRDALLALTPA